MTTSSQQLLVLRDGDGNFYLISDDVIQKSRVPEDKKQAVEQALRGSEDVAGFVVDTNIFEQTLANVPQTKIQSGTNVVAGALVGGPVLQNVANAGINIANVS